MTQPTITTGQGLIAIGLTRMGAKVDYWIPEALIDGRVLAKIIFSDIDAEVLDSGPGPKLKDLPFTVDTEAVGIDTGSGTVHDVAWELGKLTPKQVWDSRDLWEAQVKASLTTWEALSDEDRELATKKVTAAIERLIEHADELPSAVIASGNFIDFWFPID